MASNYLEHLLGRLLMSLKTGDEVTSFIRGFLGASDGALTAHSQQAAGMRKVCRGCLDAHPGDFPVFDSTVSLFVD